MKYFFCIETPLGKLTALEEEQRLTALLWGETVFAGCCRKTRPAGPNRSGNQGLLPQGTDPFFHPLPAAGH